jgi:hypothetical protein
VKAPKEHFEFNFKIAFGICQCNLDCFGGLLDFNSGGKKVIERLVEAYGFTTRQALCDHLGVSKSTMATRYMRDIFPADWVLQCAMETETSLNWLAFGEGEKGKNKLAHSLNIPKFDLGNGKLVENGNCVFDKHLLPEEITSPCLVKENNISYVCEKEFNNIRDGEWIINIDGDFSIRTIIKIPGEKVQVRNDQIVFECLASEIAFHSKIVLVISKQ